MNGRFLPDDAVSAPGQLDAPLTPAGAQIPSNAHPFTDEANEIETLNAVARGLTAELDLHRLVQKITDAGTQLTEAKFGAFFYNRIDDRGEAYMLYTLSGVPHEVIEQLGMPRNTPLFAPTFRGEGPIRLDDVTTDPRYGRNAPHHGLPEGHFPIRSYLAVPVIARGGEVLGSLLFGHPEPGKFSERAERLALGVAAQAAIALDNAHLHGRMLREIEERKRVEAALRESDQRLQVALEAGRMGTWEWVVASGKVTWSPGLETIHGRQPGTFKGTFEDVLSDVHPDDRERMLAAVRTAGEAGADYHLEYRIVTATGETRWVEARGNVFRDSAGRVERMLGVCMDITQRRLAEQAVHESERRFTRFMQHLPGLAWIKDEQGRYVFANNAAMRAFRKPREELLGRRDQELFPDDTAAAFCRNDEQARGSENGLMTIETLEHDDGVHHSIVSKFPIPGRDGAAPLIGGMAIDITERVRAEQALRDSEGRLSTLMALLPAGVYSCDAAGRITYFNRRAAELWGREPQLNDDLDRFCACYRVFTLDGTPIPPEQTPMARALREGAAFRDVEAIVERPDGTRFVASVSIDPIRDAGGRLCGAINVFQDITQRNESDRALRESEERLRVATQSGKIGVWDWDIAANRILWTDSLYAIHGVVREQFDATVEGFAALVHPEDRARVAQAIERSLTADVPYELEFRAVRPDGEVIWLFTNAVVVREAGRAVRMLGATLDVTERRRSEAALAESEQRFRTVATNAPAAIYIKDLEGRYTLANPLACRALGRPEGVIGLTDREMMPADVANVLRMHDLEVIHSNQPIEREETVGADGEFRDFLSVKFPLHGADGAPAGVCGVSIDITDRKRSAQGLRESEQRYRQLVQSLPAAVYTCDALGRIRLFNEAAVALWGRKPTIGEEWWNGARRLFRPDGTALPLHLCPMAIALKEGRAVRGEELVIERPDGTRRNVVPHPEPIFDAAGKLIGAVNMLVDITDQKSAEVAQARLAAIVTSSTDAIISKTLDGSITSWNTGAEQLFGYTAAEAIGQSIMLIIPPDLAHTEQEILAQLRRGERIDHFETQRLTKRKERIDVSISISPLRDRNGKIVGASKVGRDITARKRAEAELAAAKDDLAVQVTALKRLHELSLSLAVSTELEAGLRAILKTTVELHDAELGVLSRVDPATGRLYVSAAVGFDPAAPPASLASADEDNSASAAALSSGHRIVVEDFETDPRFVRFRPVARAAGFRAVHSTPIIDRSGTALGVLTVKFRQPRRPSVREMQFTDMCARYAYETIEAARHQQALRESEQRFRVMADTAPAMLWVTDPDGTCTFQSRAWYEFTGQETASALGYGWLSAVHPDDRAPSHEWFAEANNRRRPFAFDYRLRRFDGEYRWVIDAGHPRFDSAGRFLGYIGSVIDIHDRKQIEDALRDSEEKFRNLADNMSQFSWMTDEHGAILWFNQRWFDYTGTTLEEMQGWGWTKVQHPEHVDRVVAKFRACLEKGEPWEDTFPLRSRDGEYRWFLSRALPIRDARQRIVRWFGTNTDITERKQAEQHMRFVMAELNHRVKNTLATIDAIAHQTMRHSGTLEEFQTAFSQRLRALGHAHSLLTQTHWEGAALYDLIYCELKSRCGHESQMDIRGPAVTLRPKAALALHMVIHELCTNAAKYGALCSDVGRVQIEWAVQPGIEYDELTIRWVESGGPPVNPPTKKGFGSRVLESTIAYELEGDVELEFRSTGLVCVIVFPLREESGFRSEDRIGGETTGDGSRASHA